MQLSEYAQLLEQLKVDVLIELSSADPAERVDVLKGRLNETKDARLLVLQREIPTMQSPIDKAAAGKFFNDLKRDIQSALDAFVARQASATGTESFDPSMPARH